MSPPKAPLPTLPTVIAYIGLGSNLGDPHTQLRTAFEELDALPQSGCLAYSSLYRSAPMGSVDQPDFINAVLALETTLTPEALLGACQRLEQAHQRVRGEHWGPRTLDLDVLMYGDLRINTINLTIPHPGLYERNFVLYPLAEVAASVSPDLQVPGAFSQEGSQEVSEKESQERPLTVALQDLLANCERGELEKLS